MFSLSCFLSDRNLLSPGYFLDFSDFCQTRWTNTVVAYFFPSSDRSMVAHLLADFQVADYLSRVVLSRLMLQSHQTEPVLFIGESLKQKLCKQTDYNSEQALHIVLTE